ncbi:MAG: CCA tRNA nucleotidyltransferase [Patescibacteria group bacterium]
MAVFNKNLIPLIIKHLAARLKTKYPQANIYLVGGAVRDILLKRLTKDYDLVAAGINGKQLEKFLKAQGKVVLVGKKFGVYKLTPPNWSGESIDIALPRLDHALGTGRYRDVKIKTSSQVSIEQDLKRRDFTINAVAFDLEKNTIVDPVSGQTDLKNKIIRTVGTPKLRFQEDYSRLLRAIRFACQLNFSLESKTKQAIWKLLAQAVLAKHKNNWIIPREIIAREFLKAFKTNPPLAFELWDKTGFFKSVLPEVWAMHKIPQAKEFHSEGDVFEHTLLALKAFASRQWQIFFPKQSPSLAVILATVLHDIGKPLTLQTPAKHHVKRIMTPEHDNKGAALVSNIIARLKLTSYVDTAGDKIEADLVEWLVAKHMLLVHGHPAEFKPGTLYRYFYKNQYWGTALQQVIFADSWATQPADGRKLFDRLRVLRKRLKQLKPLLTKNGELKLLLDGNQIMKLLNLKSGPQIGQLLKNLTEAQLSKKVTTIKQAITFLKQLI